MRASLLLLPLAIALPTIAVPAAAAPEPYQALMRDGEWRAAYDLLRPRLVGQTADEKQIGQELRDAITCLQRLNRVDEADALVEGAVAVRGERWRVMQAAADAYRQLPHHGHLIAGEFRRGNHRGGGRVVNAEERDRVRRLQLLRKAISQAEGGSAAADGQAIASLYNQLAGALREGRDAAALLRQTDLATLPDYGNGWSRNGSGNGAPVDAEGDPIFFRQPGTWNDAANDGERWRQALAKMSQADEQLRLDADTRWADFIRDQYGVQTLARFGRWGISADGDDGKSRTFDLHTLGEDETLARLATGVRRFKLPGGHNHIVLYKALYEECVANNHQGQAAQTAVQLALIFQNRRQYARAAEHWRNAIRFSTNDRNREHRKKQLAQIERPLGQFEGLPSPQPAGRGAELAFRFRNATRVELTAQLVDIDKLVEDTRGYLESKPRRLDREKLQLDRIGSRLLEANGGRYLGEETAAWSQELKPADNHFDRRISLPTPLQEPGAYLVTAKLSGPDGLPGNQCWILVRVADTAIVRKLVGNDWMYFVADTRTGEPIAGAQVDFFGFRQRRGTKPNDLQVVTTRFARKTDASGMVLVDPKEANGDDRQRLQWLVTAQTNNGRRAHLGFSRLWSPGRGRGRYDQVKAVVLTDRPVYRPGQPVRFKAWIARAQHDQPSPDDQPQENEFAHKAFQVEIYDAKQNKVETRQLTANAYGGVEGEFTPEEGAPLGVYRIAVSGYGGGSFRVEEYKKPEFEVTVDAPAEGVRLGEEFEAEITARYYFGSPVTNATVKYKVVRTPQSAGWFPARPWDWLYGPGYWWPCGDDRWALGWERWGCRLPAPRWSWWWRPTPPPEVVAQGEAPIGGDGTLRVSIDTAIAKELHGDADHRYQITAEVVDRSRRAIVGTGSVLAARKTVQTIAWLDRGYYSVDDPVTVRIATRRPDGSPLAAGGVLRLLKVEYPLAEVAGGAPPPSRPAQPKETEVRRWELASDATGAAELQFKATDPGRYRIEYTSRDDKDPGNENDADEAVSGCLFTVHGEGFDSGDFEYDDLELVLDRQEYRPGDTANLRINANRRNGVVLLFVRASGSASPAPQVVRLDGKSATVPIEITRGDMPNFFVEALTLHGGRLHTRVRQIVVPPESRVAKVEVLPSAEAYRPGQEAKIKLRVTDAAGAPVMGDTVVSIYDKSVEYIAGGPEGPDLRAYFWNWRRSHSPNTEHSLARPASNLVPKGQMQLQPIGVFGWRVADELMPGPAGRRQRTMPRGGTLGDDFSQAGAPTLALPVAAPARAFGGEPEAAAGTSAAPLVEPTLRSEFADTALWVGSIETDADGLAEVSLTMPENLTAWRVRAWNLSGGTRVGQGDAEVVTRKNLLVRLQTPRFLIDTDEVVLSANVHNYLETEKQVEVRLAIEGITPESKPLEAVSGDLTRTITVPAGEDARVDWRVKAVREGEAVVTASALTDQESDAMRLRLPVRVHGAERVDSFTGVVAKNDRLGAFEINVPAKRRVEQTRLEVRYSPTLVGAMVDALPYLIEYPHGCTEQTLNRFLPAVLTQRTLERLGVDLSDGDDGAGKTDAMRDTDVSRRRNGNPVDDKAELDKIVRTGVRRLQDMQLADGGWGWFSGYGERSTPHTTAVVVRGLLIARQNDVAIVDGVIDRGVQWLENHQARELKKLQNASQETRPWKRHAGNADALVFAVLAEAGKRDQAMEKLLVRDRLELQPYTLAMLGHALHRHGNRADRDLVIRNLKQFVVTDAENQTAHLNLPDGYWWHWYGSEFEAHAGFLKLLAATEPGSDLAAGVVKYLANNRRHATYWNSTRDTALVIEAMSDYLAANQAAGGEASGEMTIEVWIDGEKRKEATVAPTDAVTFDGRFTLAGDALQPGRHTVELRKRGGGRLYYSATLTNFTLEEDLRAAGLEVRVDRKLFKLTPLEAANTVAGSRGQPINQRAEKFKRTEIPNLAKVTSGDLLEVELTIDSKNDYEYLLISDPKAAGFETVGVRSGYNGNELGAYIEYRDAAVNLFAPRLARGRHSVTYRLRAEAPGRFSSLPTRVAAMYAPELRGNSNELKVRVEDAE